MEKKDYFSAQSKIYAAFRPTYPEALYDFIFRHLKNRSCGWDCATGNGQVAHYLSRHFEKVYATDISQSQLDNAFQEKNIFYSVSSAEHTAFEENTFDLVTVGQALHWFNTDEFYQEAKRTSKSGGLIATWGYALPVIGRGIDDLFMDFYHNKVGPYWDQARKLVENEYRDIPFPFEQIPSPKFNIQVSWSLDQLTGYLNSWSATQKYIKIHGANPVDKFNETLRSHWPENEMLPIAFPVFLKLGRIHP